MTERRQGEVVWAAAAAIALVLVFWVLGTGGDARAAWLHLLGAAVVLALAFGPGSSDDTRWSGRAVAALSLLFLALAALSITTSANRGISVGSVATLVAGVALMHAAGRVSNRTAIWLMAAQCILVAPIAVSALLEPLGAGWLPSNDYYPGRAMANMGGPGPLGALLAAVIPVAAAFFLMASRRAVSILSGILVALLLTALTATFSRAGLLAAAVGLVVLITLMGRSLTNRGSRRRLMRRALIVAVLAALIIPTYNAAVRRLAPPDFETGTRPGTQTFELVRRIEGTELTNSQVRVLCWRTAARMAVSRPLNGVGAGCFGVAAEAMLPDGLQRVAAARGHVYHVPYNDYLQIGAELGIPALVAFAALVTLALMRARRRDPDRDLPHIASRSGATAAVAALLAQAFVDFPLHLPAHLTLMWVDLGLIAALAAPVASPPRAPNRRAPLRAVAAGLAVITALVMGTVAVRAVVAEWNAVGALHLGESGRGREAARLARRATELAPHEHAYWVLLAETANMVATSETEGALDPVFEAYRGAARTWPHHAPTFGRVGALYLSHAETLPAASDSALVHLRRSIALNPYYADPHTNLGTLLMTTGDPEGARTEFLRAAELDTAADALFNLGNLEASLDRFEVAEARYREALAREQNHVGTLTNLGVVLMAQDRYAEAKALLERAHELDPGSIRVTAILEVARRGTRIPAP